MGERTWIVLTAALLAVVVGGALLLWLLGAAAATWGLLGAFVFVSAILLAFGWIYDRRRPPPLDRI